MKDLKIRIDRMRQSQDQCYTRILFEKQYATDYRNVEFNNLNEYTQKPLDGTGITLLDQYVRSVFGSTIGAGPSFYGLLPGQDQKENEEIKKDLVELKRQGDWHYTKGSVRPQLFGAFHNFLLHGYYAMVINPNREKTSAQLENIDIDNIYIEDNRIMEMRGVGIRMFIPKSTIKDIMDANDVMIKPGINTPAQPEENSEQGWSYFDDDFPVEVLYTEFPYYKMGDNDAYECKMMCAYYIMDMEYNIKEPYLAQSKDKMESRIVFGTQNETITNPFGYGAIRENIDQMLKINRMVGTIYSTFDKYHEKPLIVDSRATITDNSLQFTHGGSVHGIEGFSETGLNGTIAEKPGINEPFSGYQIIQEEWQKMRMKLNAIETLLSNIRTAQSTATMAEISYRDSIEKLEYTTQLLEDELIRPVLKKFYHYLMTAGFIDTIGEIIKNEKDENETVAIGVEDMEFSIYGTQRRLTQVKDLKAILSAMEQVFSTAGALDPETLKRRINTDKLIDKIWDLSGADASILRTKDEVEEMMNAEKQAVQEAQAQQQAAQAQAGAGLPGQVLQASPGESAGALLPTPSA